MEIKSNVYLMTKPGNLKAVADISIDDTFVVKGFRVMDGKNGLFVSMPSRQVGNEYEDTFYGLTDEARESVQKSVLDKYQQVLDNKMTQDKIQTDDGKKSSKKSQKADTAPEQEQAEADDRTEDMAEPTMNM